MGTSHTYGVIGLSTSVLVVALLGLGMFRGGGLLLGLAPALHPGMGLWTIVIAAIAIVLGERRREEFRSIAVPFAIGCVLSGISYAIHVAITPSIPSIPAGTAREYLEALLRYWDGHRRPAHLNNAAVWINAGLLLISFVWLTWLRRAVPAHAQVIMRFVLAASVLSLVFTLASWLPPEALPATIQILMPLRLLNIGAMIAPALAFGLVGVAVRNWAGQLVALVLTAGLLVSLRSDLWPLLPGGTLRDVTGPIFDLQIDALRLMAACVVAVTMLIAVWSKRNSSWSDGAVARQPSKTAPVFAAIHGALVVAVLLIALPALRNRDPVVVQYRDRSHDPFFFTVASERGMLLTGNALRLIQLRTRRPVLVDGGGLDGLAYSLDAGPALNRILRDVYGVDLLNPPADGEGMWGGAIPPAVNRAAWERYDVDRWREIRRTYGATQVLTHSDWKLNLPVRMQTAELTLYEIPSNLHTSTSVSSGK